jgi:hypothetical protein
LPSVFNALFVSHRFLLPQRVRQSPFTARIRHAVMTGINWVQAHRDLGHKKNLADVFAVLDEVMGISYFIEFEGLRNLRLDDALHP